MKLAAPSIRVEEEGFSLIAENGTPTCSVRWAEVEAVLAYKRDAFAFDVICAAFGTPAGVVEVSEGCEGWDELMNALPEHLPGARSWREVFPIVALPPFATQPTTVFKRAGE